LGGVEQGEKDAAKCGLAAGGIVPLLQRVDTSSGTSAAHGDCGYVSRERDVSVGRAKTRLSAEREVTIDCSQGVNQRRVVGKSGSRSISDGFDVVFCW
jgi:hypothetical protein